MSQFHRVPSPFARGETTLPLLKHLGHRRCARRCCLPANLGRCSGPWRCHKTNALHARARGSRHDLCKHFVAGVHVGADAYFGMGFVASHTLETRRQPIHLHRLFAPEQRAVGVQKHALSAGSSIRRIECLPGRGNHWEALQLKQKRRSTAILRFQITARLKEHLPVRTLEAFTGSIQRE